MSIKYSKELLEDIVKDCTSIAQVIRKLGLKQSGGTHSHITSRIKKYEINTSHFLGIRANSGENHFPKKISSIKILVNDRLNGRRDSASRLRRALLEVGIEHKCMICGLLPIWNNKYLQLQIDHINGNFIDNRVENLRFLCGNCHIQTETFGVKNSSLQKEKISIKNINWRNNPRPNQRKVERPSKIELEKLLWEKPTIQLAKDFGVSGKAIEKWAKLYKINKPPRGYWAKKNVKSINI